MTRLRLLVLAGFALAASWLAAGCEQGAQPDTPDAEAAAAAPQRPLQRFYDYKLTETTAGVRQWVLVSDEMQKYRGEEDVRLIEVHMDFYRGGDHFSVLTSDSGQADLQSRNVHVWGQVVVITDDGRKLETEELYFDNERQIIHNEIFNRFTRDGDVLTGIGLEATPDLEYIEIKQQVEAEVTDTPSGPAGGESSGAPADERQPEGIQEDAQH